MAWPGLTAYIRKIVVQTIRAMVVDGYDGLVVPGSWDPTEGTVHVAIGLTGTLADGTDDNAMQVVPVPIPVVTNQVGVQGGPIGLERVTLIPFEGGFLAHLRHGPDDTPGAPAGEMWLCFRSQNQSLQQIRWVRIQSDATRLSHDQKISAVAPLVILGMDESQDGMNLMRQTDDQTVMNQAIQNVQDAINELAAMVQPGEGVNAPNIAAVTSQGSQVSFSK